MRRTTPDDSRRQTRGRASFGLLFLAALILPAGCAYNYAGQEGEEQQQREVTEDPNVVQIDDGEQSDGSDDPDGDEESTEAEGDPAESAESTSGEPNSGCGVEVFEIHYYDASTQITKKIDCQGREVVSVNRSPISQSKRQAADSSGLPEETWYLLVDPKGIRAKFLTNDQLITISREFDIQFLGRDQKRNLLIYEYRGDL
jgi:hypothetical protein